MRTSQVAHIESGWPEGSEPGPEPPAEQQASGAMRSWLVRGTRKFSVDRRRRYGRHGQSRLLLAGGSAESVGSRGTWQGVVAALQRQAVHGALAQLRKTDRQILTLAYLRGLTNREIAAQLGVSVSTVRRRISAALARLDEYVRQARIWMASLAVFAAAHVRATRWPGALSTGAAATAAVVAMGVVAVGPDNYLEPKQAHRPAARTIGDAAVPPAMVLSPVPQPATNEAVRLPLVIKSVQQVVPATHRPHKRSAQQTGNHPAVAKDSSENESQGGSQDHGDH